MSDQYPQFPPTGNGEPVRMPTEPPLQPPTQPAGQPATQPSTQPAAPPTMPLGPTQPVGGIGGTPPPTPPTGGPQGFGGAVPQPSSPTNKGGTLALILLIVVVVAATVGFALVGLNASRNANSPMTMSILECSLSEAGDTRVAVTLSDSSGDSNEVSLNVVIVDLDTGEEIDTTTDEIEVAGQASQRWEYSGAAGDEVQQITCNVTAELRN